MPTPLRDQLVSAFERTKKRQEDLADAIGRERSTVAKFASGERDTPTSVADAWAAACGYEIVLVPLATEDPEGLHALIDTLRDPFARSVVADLVRVAKLPGATEYIKTYAREFAGLADTLRARADLKASLSK